MKRKIVLWGTNEKDEKILIALHLQDKEGKVNLYTFSEEQATEEFYNKMLNQWRENVDVEFPEGHSLVERPLNMKDSILPETIKVERTDIISRAQTEWHFVVLSAKLYDMYRTELDELGETIENLKEYDNKMWTEMRNFWSKVQEQVIEKNLFREHASTLKSKTNKLFDHLKVLKKKVEEEYEANSAKHKEIIMAELQDIENRVNKGLGLKPIFDELKTLQSRLRGIKFTKSDRNSIWDRLDAAFKVVKEKRFGDSEGQGKNSTASRLENRYNGLLNAIKKMEQSIKRDRDDQKFQDKRIANSDGQLEMQIRQAKLKMIEERIKSKDFKLQDMYKTKTELESRIAKEKVKEEKKAQTVAAKKAAEDKIAEEVKKSAEKVEASAEELEKAAAKIAESKKSVPPVALPTDEGETKKEEPKEEGVSSMMGAIAATVGEALGGVGEALEDVVDTVKAVADVVEDKIEDAVENITSNVDEEE